MGTFPASGHYKGFGIETLVFLVVAIAIMVLLFLYFIDAVGLGGG